MTESSWRVKEVVILQKNTAGNLQQGFRLDKKANCF